MKKIYLTIDVAPGEWPNAVLPTIFSALSTLASIEHVKANIGMTGKSVHRNFKIEREFERVVRHDLIESERR